jgi:hypothetical protein
MSGKRDTEEFKIESVKQMTGTTSKSVRKNTITLRSSK